MYAIRNILALAGALAPFLATAGPVNQRHTLSRREVIPGQYIVQLKQGMAPEQFETHQQTVNGIFNTQAAGGAPGAVDRRYGIGKFSGYCGHFDAATAEEIRKLEDVVSVEEDYMMYTTDLVTQENATWGLASISHRRPGSTEYVYDDTAGEGQFVYVVDSGVRITHREFGGRGELGFNAVPGTEHVDTIGHGTHVAGTAVGQTYGVAKKAQVISVKVFEGRTGSTSQIMSGFDWAVNDIVSKNRQNSAVINLSLGGPGSTTWDNAMTASFEQGVLSVVAAGNNGGNAVTTSPARSPEAVVVGNIGANNSRAATSNYGSTLDLFAPGTNILSAWFDSDTSTNTISGTSMASPHVAGLVAYLRGLEGDLDAAAVSERLVELSTKNVVNNPGPSSPANIAFNGASSSE